MENVDQHLQETLELAAKLFISYGRNILGAITILMIGWWFAGHARTFSIRAFQKTRHIDDTLTGFLANGIRYLIIIITVLAVLDRFGVETTSFVAILGATSLAIGVALQGTLSNVAAGVMLLFFRPFNVGDYIEGGGEAGIVKSIGLFVTNLSTPDNIEVIIPNGSLWDSAIKNYNFNPTRRINLVFGISYSDDIQRAMDVISSIIESDTRSHKDPEPIIVVGELGASSVGLITRVWCNREDYWRFRWDLLKTVKEAFDTEGISIPFPQTDIHLHKKN